GGRSPRAGGPHHSRLPARSEATHIFLFFREGSRARFSHCRQDRSSGRPIGGGETTGRVPATLRLGGRRQTAGLSWTSPRGPRVPGPEGLPAGGSGGNENGDSGNLRGGQKVEWEVLLLHPGQNRQVRRRKLWRVGRAL